MSGIFDRATAEAPPAYTENAPEVVPSAPPEPGRGNNARSPDPVHDNIALLICRNSAQDNAAFAARLAAPAREIHLQPDGRTLLGVACEHHNLPIVRILLERGADARPDAAGYRPADYIFAGPPASPKLALHRGAPAPSHMAAMVRLLSEHGQLVTSPQAVAMHTPAGHPAHAVMSMHQFCPPGCSCCTPEKLAAAVQAYMAQP